MHRVIAVLLSLCLALALAAGTPALAASSGEGGQAAEHAVATPCDQDAHAAPVDCGSPCLGAGHCLTGTPSPFSLAGAPAANAGPPLGARPAPPPPCERLERPPRLA